jgi:hypothetical protein
MRKSCVLKSLPFIASSVKHNEVTFRFTLFRRFFAVALGGTTVQARQQRTASISIAGDRS